MMQPEEIDKRKLQLTQKIDSFHVTPHVVNCDPFRTLFVVLWFDIMKNNLIGGIAIGH